MAQQHAPVSVNGRDYPFPDKPLIVICLDGCEPEYLDKAIAAQKMPALERVRKAGKDLLAHSVIPSFTNPNNMSIATGRPPAVHGICGNYLYDPETGDAVMMNDPVFLRAPTIFESYYKAGAKVAIVTAKDKLRTLLGHGLSFDEDRAICFSSENLTQLPQRNTELTTHRTGSGCQCLKYILQACPNLCLQRA